MGDNDHDSERENLSVHWRHPEPRKWIVCPLCGASLADRRWDGKDRRYCDACGFVYWERPVPAAAAIVYDPRQRAVVLVTRRYPPSAGGITLPGGGIEIGESVADAVVREVREETGLDVVVVRQFGTWSTPSNETIITFFVVHPVGGRLEPGSDALEARWVPLASLPPLAFSVHQQVAELFVREVGLGTYGPV